MARRHFLAPILCACVLLAVAQWHCSGQASKAGNDAGAVTAPVLDVKAVEVKPEEWDLSVPVSGSLRSKSNVDVKAEVAGRVIAMYFEEGDSVHSDQLLAEIDPSNYQLALQQAKAALLVAEAGLGRAQVGLDHAVREKLRGENLLRTGGITERDYQTAFTAVKEGEAQVKLSEAQCGQARAAISVAEKGLKDCRLTAAEDGRVQRKFIDKGSLVSSGVPLYSIVDNARMELECSVPASQLSEIRLGQRVIFTTPTFRERRFEGSVAAINPMVESDNRSIKISVRVSNSGGELLSGMFARGQIEVRQQAGVLVVPRPALADSENAESGSLYIIENGKASRRRIRVGGIQQDRVWVQEGIRSGDWVIVEIGPNLKDGAAVRRESDSEPSRKMPAR
jgi:membrane fusion protein, multidrug efflux system